MTLRRKDALRDLHVLEETARSRAERMVREAAREAEVLREHRDRVADVLRVVHSLLGKAAGHLQVGNGR